MKIWLYHLNDLHGEIARLTPHTFDPVYSRLYSYLRQVRSQKSEVGEPVLFFSTGDEYAGSWLEAWLDFQRDQGIPPRHPVYKLAQLSGMTAATLGNHDFDHGLELLANAVSGDSSQALLPLICANLKTSHPISAYIQPYVTIKVGSLTLGVTGITTPLQSRYASEYTITDPLDSLLAILPDLRRRSDLVILLSHSGYSFQDFTGAVVGVGDCELAAALPPGLVDVIIGGHTHTSLNHTSFEPENLVNGIAILQAGGSGNYLGEACLEFNSRLTQVSARLIPVSSLPPSDEFDTAQLLPLVAQVRSYWAQPLGDLTWSERLSPNQLHLDYNTGEHELGNYLADGLSQHAADLGFPVDLALVDQSIVQTGFEPESQIYRRHLYTLVPYNDPLLIIEISGAQLLDVLTDNAFRLTRPGELHPNTGFAHFSRQLRVILAVDPHSSLPSISSAQIHGHPINPARSYTLTLPGFFRIMARRWEFAHPRPDGLPWQNLASWQPRVISRSVRRELAAWIARSGGITPSSGLLLDGRLAISTRPSEPPCFS